MPAIHNWDRENVRYARQASEDACAFCRVLATGLTATSHLYHSAESATEVTEHSASRDIGQPYHTNCRCQAVPVGPGEDYWPPNYVEQWQADYDAARDDPDVDDFDDLVNYLRRLEYAREHPEEQPPQIQAASYADVVRKADTMDVVTKRVDADVIPVESDNPNGEFKVILSTEALDRDGERLLIDEWKQPLPARIHIDGDHDHKIEKTVGSVVPRIEGNRLLGDGAYAPTPYAQLVRQIVNDKYADGHAVSLSVTFAQRKNQKDAKPERELLKAAFVSLPSNTEAIVLSSKAAKDDGDKKKPYGDVTYADPKNNKYPVDTEAHVRAAWSYINMPKNASQYSAEELSAIKGRIRSAAKKFGIEIADDKKSAALFGMLFKQLDASGNNPQMKHDDAVQAIHDAAYQLGAQCAPYPGTEEEEEQESSNTKSVGSPRRSPDESPADAATKAAASAPAEVPADAAEESAELVASKEALSLRARGLSYLAQKTCTQE
jgi:hypothetical protein